jgi:hypothetical protein
MWRWRWRCAALAKKERGRRDDATIDDVKQKNTFMIFDRKKTKV